MVAAAVSPLADGQLLVRNEYLSVDPAMRGWVNEADNYRPTVPLGAVMPASAVGTVVESRSGQYKVGDTVVGRFGWQEYSVVDSVTIDWTVADEGLPASLSLGVLGVNGITAWFGVKEVLRPTAAGTVVVSTAAGSVGSAAGQLAAALGCRTVGIAGGPGKVDLCTSVFGYDAAVDYKAATFADDLRAACPDGVDAYFDNTGGSISDEVLSLLAVHGSVVICGTASLPIGDGPVLGPRIERRLLTRRARMEGMLVGDFRPRFPEALSGLSSLVKEGRLAYREDILDGLELAPGALEGLFAGDNVGKRLIRMTT